MTKIKLNTFMRVDKGLLGELKRRKKHRKESYANVIRRIIDKDRSKILRG